MFTNLLVNTSKTETRKAELLNLYRNLYCNGGCRSFIECAESINMKCHDNWDTFDWSARVGINYDLTIDGVDVRILIIGKEAKELKNQLNDPSQWWPGIKRHYQVTYNTLKQLFNYYPADDSNNHILSMYALTNVYSCAFRSKPDQTTGIKNSPIQKNNCLLIRKKEIEILEPTVILIQYDYLNALDLFDDAVVCCNKVFYSPKQNCHIIESSHPCCRRHPWRQDLNESINYIKANGIIPDLKEI